MTRVVHKQLAIEPLANNRLFIGVHGFLSLNLVRREECPLVRELMILPFPIAIFGFSLKVKLPEDIMLEEGTTLSSVAPIVKAGGIVPER